MADRFLYPMASMAEAQLMLELLSRLVDDCHQLALDRGAPAGLCDAVDANGEPYQSEWAKTVIEFSAGVCAMADGVPGATDGE